jgi:hypothetical protein
MARRVFYSFHYSKDCWRVSQVKNIGTVEGQPLLSSNGWEEVEKGGDAAIEKWINDNMAGKSCLVVLIGEKTAGRRWVKHEIKKAWKDGKGVMGVYIHGLKDAGGNQGSKGADPFDQFTVNGGEEMTKYAKAHDTPFASSTYVYDHIKENLSDWVEQAIELRKQADA